MPTLLEAIQEKHGSDEDADSVPIGCAFGRRRSLAVSIYAPRRTASGQLCSLVLDDCHIDRAPLQARAQLEQLCSQVRDLDLAKNDLRSWKEIFSILSAMPQLKFANLSFNDLSKRMSSGGGGEREGCTRLNLPPSLCNLVLNSTGIDWANVRAILSQLPNLEELHLSNNDLDDVQLLQLSGPSLTRLYFAGNPVRCWQQISEFGKSFPNLKLLVLAECPIQSIQVPGESAHQHFQNLQILNLTNSNLQNWEDVDALAEFPEVTNLRIMGCPLLNKYTKQERRQFSIARLPNVTLLNGGGTITAEERQDAERAFLRHYATCNQQDVPQRYRELIKIHGYLNPLANVDMRPERKVSITLECDGHRSQYNLDVRQTVRQLKHKLEGLCGLPANRMRLFYADHEMVGVIGPDHMRFPDKRLYSYNIRPGDMIIVESKE